MLIDCCGAGLPAADYQAVRMLLGPPQVVVECVQVAVPITADRPDEAFVEGGNEVRP